MDPFPFILYFIHILNTFHADISAPVGYQSAGGSAENAGGFIFFQDHFVIIQVDLQFIPFGDIQSSAKLDWKNDPAQLIYFTNNSGRFHVIHLSFVSLITQSYYLNYYTNPVRNCQCFYPSFKTNTGIN